MKRRLLSFTFVTLLLLSGSARASSLFALQGVGVPIQSQNTRSISLGGVDGPLADSLYLSVTNPAGWYNTGRTRFTMNSRLTFTAAKSNSGATASSDDFGFPSFGFALPIYRGLGIGVNFRTKTDYEFYTKRTTNYTPVPEDTSSYKITEVLQGTGGLSTASSNFGIKVNRALSVGLALDYVFGKLDRELTTLSDDLTLSTGGYTQHRVVSGLAVRFGALAHRGDLTLSGSFGLPAKLKVDQAIQVVGGDSLTIPSATLELPFSIGVGGAYKSGRYLAVGEGRFDLWGSTSQDIGTAAYTNAWQIGVGLERQRLVAPLLPWYEKVTYRVGVHAKRLNVEANNNPIDGFGIAAGVGMPMKTHMGMLDLGVTLDWLGNPAKNGVRERTFGVRLGIISTEGWFVRRKR